MAQHTKTVVVTTCDYCETEIEGDYWEIKVVDIEDGLPYHIELCATCKDKLQAACDRGSKSYAAPNECWCGRSFSSEQGLGIHKGRMGHWSRP